MLSVLDEKKELFQTLDFSQEELEKYRKKSFFCPGCQEAVVLRNGKVMVPHFAHQANADCSVFSENESKQHLSLKKIFFEWGEETTLESYLPQLSQRPDVLLGKNTALEIQCSHLKIDRLAERTSNYQKNGYQVIWLAGKKFFLADKISNLQLGMMQYSKKFGYYLWACDIEKKVLRLCYFIAQDINRQAYFQVKEFPFGSGNLAEILAIPREKDVLMTRRFHVSFILQKYIPPLFRKMKMRDKKTLSLQSFFYNKQMNLLQLPKYYYFSGIAPLCSREDVFIWKFYLYEVLTKGVTMEQCVTYLKQSLPNAVLFPQFSTTEVFEDFVLEELQSLKECGCLRKEGDKFFLIPHFTKKPIPKNHRFQNVPVHESRLPRKNL